jgi:rhodanese-related sulfurtransferase
MMKKLLHILLATAMVVTSTSVLAYNQELAASYQKLFEPVAGIKAGKALHLVKPDAFMEDLKKGKQIVTIDVRTPAESVVFTMTLPGSLSIPANEVFKPENLARLPKDKQIVVVCKSGTRASVVGTALRHVGFNNVYILKGGIKALNVYLDPKTANTPPKAENK